MNKELYHSAGEVIRAGRLLEENDALRQIKLEQLRYNITVAVESEECSEMASLEMEGIIAEGKRRLAAREPK